MMRSLHKQTIATGATFQAPLCKTSRLRLRFELRFPFVYLALQVEGAFVGHICDQI